MKRYKCEDDTTEKVVRSIDELRGGRAPEGVYRTLNSNGNVRVVLIKYEGANPILLYVTDTSVETCVLNYGNYELTDEKFVCSFK